MTDEVLETYIRQYIEAQRAPEVTIAWQGGEPTLMGVDFFRRAVELRERHRRPGPTISNTIQTNGTLLDDEWCELPSRAALPRGAQHRRPARSCTTRYRVDKRRRAHVRQGDGGRRAPPASTASTSTCCARSTPPTQRPPGRGVPLLPRRARAAPHPAHPDRGARTTTTRFQEGEHGHRPLGRARRSGARFLIAVFDEWVVARRRRGVRADVRRGPRVVARRPRPRCASSQPTCGDALALEHNGDLYSCDHFVEPDVPARQHHAARPWSSWSGRRAAARVRARRSATRLPRYCRECDVRFACHGECPKNRFTLTPDGEPGLNYLCAGLQGVLPPRRPADARSWPTCSGRDATPTRRWASWRTRRRGCDRPSQRPAATTPAPAAAAARRRPATAGRRDPLTAQGTPPSPATRHSRSPDGRARSGRQRAGKPATASRLRRMATGGLPRTGLIRSPSSRSRRTTRIPELVPVRYGRMLASPFSFYRGAALPMAADLAKTPTSGIRVQLGGDATSNSGLFASRSADECRHERFDETLPARSSGTSSAWRRASVVCRPRARTPRARDPRHCTRGSRLLPRADARVRGDAGDRGLLTRGWTSPRSSSS